MRRYVFAGILTVATATLAHAQASPPVIGWSVSAGHSTAGSTICTLSGDFGNHSDLAWIADGTGPSEQFTLLFDDGGASPRPQSSVSKLTFSAPRSRPLTISGTVRFGQFKTTVDRRAFDPFLHLFIKKRSMTVTLDGEPLILVNLDGSHDAARYMRRCEAAEPIPESPKPPLRVEAAAATHHKRSRAPEALMAFASPSPVPPLPGPPPAAPPLPAPAPVMTQVALKPPVAVEPPLPAPPPAAAPPAAPTVPAPAPVIAPAALTPPVAVEPPLPAPPPADPSPAAAPSAAPASAAPVVQAPDPVIAPVALKPPVAAETTAPASTPALAAEADRKDALLLGKVIEDQFVAILQDGRASYENSSDRDLSVGARATRATDLCILLGDKKQAIDWTGTISDLSTSSQGGGVLAVKLADGVTVGAVGGGSQEVKDTPTIDPASDLFKVVSKMHVGDQIVFSGHFIASDPDCVKENSLTESRSMTAPHFAMTFSAVEAQR